VGAFALRVERRSRFLHEPGLNLWTSEDGARRSRGRRIVAWR